MDISNFKKTVIFLAFLLAAPYSYADVYSLDTYSSYQSSYQPSPLILNCYGCPKTAASLLTELKAQGVKVIEIGNQLEIILGVDRIFRPRSNTRVYTSQIRTMQLVSQYLILRGYGNSAINVYGHTDEVGSDRAKLRRSMQQAETIKAYLWAGGVPLGNLRAIGCGDTEPVASNQTVDGSAANRRIEIITGPPWGTEDGSPTGDF